MARTGAAGAGVTINTARPNSTARAADLAAQNMHARGGSAKQKSQHQHLQQMRRYDQPTDNQGMLNELDYRFPNNGGGGVTLYEQTLRQFRSLDPTPHPSNNNPISHRPVTRKLKDNSLNSTIKRGPNFQQGPPSKVKEAQNTSSANRSIQKNKSNF